MGHKVILSIIIPVFNCEKYLAECIESVLNQSFKDFELILINDGSVDRSQLVCENYSKIDGRIVIINQQNYGVSVARNRGIEIAKGQYLTFIDADDLIRNDTYKKNISFLINNPEVDILQYPVCRCFNSQFENLFSPETQTLYGESDFIQGILNKVLNFSFCNRIFKKTLFNKLYFPVGVRYEDSILFIRVLEKVREFHISNDGLYYYRYNKDSFTNKKRTCKDIIDEYKAKSFIINYVSNHSLYHAKKIYLYKEMVDCYCRLYRENCNIDNGNINFMYLNAKPRYNEIWNTSFTWKGKFFLFFIKIFGLKATAKFYKIFDL